MLVMLVMMELLKRLGAGNAEVAEDAEIEGAGAAEFDACDAGFRLAALVNLSVWDVAKSNSSSQADRNLHSLVSFENSTGPL